ncbi:hypothetical protein DFH06DRAFT_614806 [Mycena polygramma]|nr:hypothetical protein DFH06DRAFT_614806 [Mycena polygramma]
MDPELAKVISGNLPPTDLQSRDIRRMLAVEDAELVQLDQTILAVSLVLSELESQRSRRWETVVALHGAISPIRRIPPEIVADIFLLCRDNSMTSLTYSIADPREAPIVLGQVSSRWRSICHGTPLLWNNVRLMSGSGMPGLPYIQTLLARSQNLPVSAQLTTRGEAVLTPEPVVGLFLGLHNRLKNVTLDIPTSNLLPPHNLSHNEVFPLLTCLEIILTDPSPADAASALSTFRKAPSLDTVLLISDCVPLHSQSLPDALPWSQLTELTLHLPISLRDARLILTLCQRLQILRLSECTWPLDSAERVVQLPALRVLDFDTESEEDDATAAFFGAFSFPGLQDLDIHATAFSPDILPNLLDRSRFKLEILVLSDFFIPSDSLLQMLRFLPTLRQLTLSYCGIDNEVFAHFTLDPLSASYPLTLPQLERLSLSEYTYMSDGASAADMAKSLCLHSGRHTTAFPALRSVFLSLNGEKFDADVECRLAAACSTGLVVDEGVRT